MCDIDRRDFIRLGSAGAAGLGLMGAAASSESAVLEPGRPIAFLGDGLNLGPREYAAVLAEITADADFEQDYYSNGGVVADFEKRMAEILGKETAVFLPTGTLANHLGVRLLCQRTGRWKVVAQTESHLANDTGDGCETLAGLRLVTLSPGEVGFTLEQVKSEHARVRSGRVEAGIGAISIESPVRRKLGGVFDFDQASRISDWARSQDIGLHLDGARLFMAAEYTGISVDRWASLFDTVFVSAWKYFNAGSGAVLAGPADLLEGLFNTRRMYGGSLIRGWVYAAVALHFLDGFEERFAQGVAVSTNLFARLEKHPDISVRAVPNGSNVFILEFSGADPRAFHDRMKAAGVLMRRPRGDDSIVIQVNETWAAASAEDLGRMMISALG